MPNLDVGLLLWPVLFWYCSKVRLFQNIALSNLFLSIVTICHYYTYCIFLFCSVQDLFKANVEIRYIWRYYQTAIIILRLLLSSLSKILFHIPPQYSYSHWYNTIFFSFYSNDNIPFGFLWHVVKPWHNP